MSMSLQVETEEEIEVAAEEEAVKIVPTDFEKWVMQCCKAPEYDLRKFLKKALTRAGFEIFEDEYKSDRCDKDKRYSTVHNLLAVRGNPKICLASHTDICRDHEELRGDSKYGHGGEYAFWMNGRHVDESEVANISQKTAKVEPTLKIVEHEGEIYRIIQDKNCRFQVGGDDRLGVAINTYIALNTGYDMAIYLPTDEEIGLKSARVCEMAKLKEFDLIAEVDRGNHSDELVIKISNEILCDYNMACRLLEIAYDCGMPRAPVTGMSTDVYALKSRGMCKNAVNMTCGYHQSFGASGGEYIEVSEAASTMKYVAAIVRDFYLKGGSVE